MIAYLLTGVVVTTGLIASVLIDDFKKYENERKIINTAQDISEQNNTLNKIVSLDSAISKGEVNNNLSNSKLLANKPMAMKIVSFENGKKEKDIVNRYASAAKIILKDSPNANINCSVLASTNLITVEECETVHEKNYNFYHKLDNGNIAYQVEDNNVKKYVSEIEAHKYNLKIDDVSGANNKVVLDKNYISAPNKFIDKKNLNEKENSLIKVRNYIKNSNYILASSELYNLKKNNYEFNPFISSLYVQLFDEVYSKTKDATSGENYELKLKIQSEFMKLTKNSNILENLDVENHLNAKLFIASMVDNYNSIRTLEKQQNIVSESLPLLNNFVISLNNLGSNTTILK